MFFNSKCYKPVTLLLWIPSSVPNLETNAQTQQSMALEKKGPKTGGAALILGMLEPCVQPMLFQSLW